MCRAAIYRLESSEVEFLRALKREALDSLGTSQIVRAAASGDLPSAGLGEKAMLDHLLSTLSGIGVYEVFGEVSRDAHGVLSRRVIGSRSV